MSARALVVAGVASGVGKTSITLGLLAALRRRGLRVALEDLDGRMRPHGLTLGYAEVTLGADCPPGAAGTRVRGQEFHARVYRVRAHRHFSSSPGLVPALVAACEAGW